ncbi:hypothetical protein INR49_015069 [Caranx melampygus]|nr:hypothetical protein INR49_015069 [Caranx melampygus]
MESVLRAGTWLKPKPETRERYKKKKETPSPDPRLPQILVLPVGSSTPPECPPSVVFTLVFVPVLLIFPSTTESAGLCLQSLWVSLCGYHLVFRSVCDMNIQSHRALKAIK